MLYTKRTDTYDIITYQCETEDGGRVDLTGASVNFVMGKKNKLITNAPAQITSAVDGIVSYQLTASDTLVSGQFLGEFEVTFANGDVKHFPSNGYINVNIADNIDTNNVNVVLDMIAVKQGDFEAKLSSILAQAGNVNMSSIDEYTWNAIANQVTYVFPVTSSYTKNAKWFKVYVGNIPVDDSLINRSAFTSFELMIDPTLIKEGTKVTAQWMQPMAAIAPTSYKVIPQQDIPPVDAVEGDMWFDTSDDTYQGTILEGIDTRMTNAETSLADIATVNVKNYATLQDAFNAAPDKGIVLFPIDGTYTLNTSFTVKNKNLTIIGNGVEIGGSGVITFDSDLSASVSANNIADGDYKIQSDLAVTVGDYIEINGAISHALYAPYRYTNVKVIAKVSAIDTSTTPDTLTLDRQISYSLTSVTVSKILSPYRLNVQNLKFNGSQIDVKHCVGGKIEAHCKGARGTGNALAIEQSAGFDVSLTTSDLQGTFGLLLNDCNQFNVYINSTRTGLFDGTGTKALRGNGLQNGYIKGIFDSSPVADSTIYGSRSLRIDYQTVGGGRYYRQNNITTGNRLESVQFSECDNVDVTIAADKVDDQAIEFLGCYRSVIRPKINTLSGSTEGAIVIKGGSQEITILNPVIRCYNNYGIKIETTDGQSTASNTTVRTNNVKIINPDIVNLSASGVGIVTRDSPISVNVFAEINGGHVKAMYPISTNDTNQNNVTIKNTIVESTGGHAIQGLADYLTVDNVTALGCNDTTIRAVVSSGANDKISNVSSDGAIYVRDQSRFNFSLTRFNGNRVPRIYLDQDAYSFYIDKGQFKVDSAPSLYTIENGTRLYKRNVIAGDNDGWACVRSGSTYPAWTTGTGYIVGQYVNNGGNVYKCKTAGTAGATAPTGTGTGISDGVCVWDYVSAYTTFTINPFGAIRQRAIGAITIPASTTQITATHNLGFQPVAWGMSINVNLSGNWYIDSVNSTTMVLHIPSTASATYATFWVEG